MALQLGALREALIEAGTSPERAGRAAEELARHDREFAGLRAEMKEGFFAMKGEFSALRAEVKGDISGVRAELKSDIAELRAESRSDIKLLQWMTGATFATVLPILLKMFVH